MPSDDPAAHVRAVCPKCQAAFRVLAAHAGRPARCARCGQRFPVPEVPLAGPPPVEDLIQQTLAADPSPAPSIEELKGTHPIQVPMKRPLPVALKHDRSKDGLATPSLHARRGAMIGVLAVTILTGGAWLVTTNQTELPPMKRMSAWDRVRIPPLTPEQVVIRHWRSTAHDPESVKLVRLEPLTARKLTYTAPGGKPIGLHLLLIAAYGDEWDSTSVYLAVVRGVNAFGAKVMQTTVVVIGHKGDDCVYLDTLDFAKVDVAK